MVLLVLELVVEKPRLEHLTFVVPQNFFHERKPMLSNNRKSIIKAWPEVFINMEETYTFSVVIHKIPFKFFLRNEKLLKELELFFPKQWQTESSTPYEIFWKAPEESQWSFSEGPFCEFEGSFVSQRDFVFKEKDNRQIELLAQEEVSDGFFNFLRAFLPTKLLENDQILFHSSCVIDESNQPFLFFGPSGAGKTTVSKICREEGAQVLGDDMNLLTIKKEQIFVEAATVGQRYYNKSLFNLPYPLKTMYWLKQAEELHTTAINTDRVSLFLSSFANIFWDQLPKESYQKVFTLLSHLNSNINLLELSFPKNKKVWSHVCAK